MTLPPLRSIPPVASDIPYLFALDAVGCDRQRAEAFGALLRDVRRRRGFEPASLRIFVSDDNPARTPPELPGVVWAPHVAAWAPSRAAGLAWEADTPERLSAALGAPADHIAIWADQPAALLRMANRAAATSAGGPYLSLRWVLSHLEEAVTATTSEIVFDHVSLHATPAETARVRALLRDALGLLEVPRPASINIPGHWLAVGPVRVHLNARDGVAATAEGTAPNHVCLRVEDLDAAQAAVEAHGFACQRAGSLDGQVWFRLGSGTVIELQQRRGRRRSLAE